MRFDALQTSLLNAECDVLIVSIFEGEKAPGGGAGEVDKATNGAISALIDRENFEGKSCNVSDFTPSSGVKAAKIVLVGLGKKDDLTVEKIRRASSAAARRAKDLSAVKVATDLYGVVNGIETAAAAQAIVEGTILGTYKFIKYKTSDAKPNTIEAVSIIGVDTNSMDKGIAMGQTIAEAKNFSRDLTNEPSNVLTPTYLAEQAETIAKETGLECQVMGKDEIISRGMNLFMAVARGSVQEPKFIVLNYKSANAKKTVALVGKGITFDSGGLNIKVGAGMDTMKDDMSGAGVVLAAMKAIASLKPNVNVMGIVAACENMPSGDATRPGDIITGLSGKTVEINNTDAEGRLTLADAVNFAEKANADEIIDIATLTGACVVALGREMAGILGSDQTMIDNIIKAGNEGGEPFWQLPLFEDYKDELKSDFADMKNSGGRGAGTINGALFIKEHVEKTAWVHLDIAGPCFMDKETPTGPKGGSGFGVATLVNYVLNS